MEDLRGNPVSTRSSAALDAAERALWRMMSFYGTPLDDLDAADAADPAWCLPPLMKAGFLLSLTEPAVLPRARELLATAQQRSRNATPREQAHIAALTALAAGDWDSACSRWQALLIRHPRDALALQWAHLFDFYRGDTHSLQQRAAQVLPAWRDDDPLHPYLLGIHAFGLEENGRYAEADETGRRALAGGTRVPWAIHAVAHVMEMQGRYREGSDWMAHWQPVWSAGNGFAGHLGWHGALFALEGLDGAAALRQFDAHLAADPLQITLQRLDAAALLWRMHLLGMDTGPRWAALAAGWDYADSAAGRYPFNDLHGLLALIGSGDMARAEAWIGQVARGAEQAGATARSVAREVGSPLMRGVLAFATERHDEAVGLLRSARASARRFGGSHAQRDLIDQTLMAAAARSSAHGVGRELLAERRLGKPDTPLTAHWAARLGRS